MFQIKQQSNLTMVRTIVLAGLGVLILGLVQPASAHVKWFTDFNYLERPLTLAEIMTPTFIALALLSFVVIGGMVVIDKQLDQTGWYGRINQWLIQQQSYSVVVMRIAMATLLLVSWSSNAILAPELSSNLAWLVWLQFILALMLLFPKMTPYAGAGLIGLYLLSIIEFGFFHLLDYLHYAGIGFYLLTSQMKDDRIRGLGLPALYATIGFSLIWLGFEKLVYPGWSLYLIEQTPQLALGLPPEFFLQGAAFVEISLGYLLLIGLLERPLAAIITLVFFTTTLVFGKVEVIGHTPLHAALIVFLFNGPGHVYKPPIGIHKRLNWRVMFATVNLVVILLLFGFSYTATAQSQYETAVANATDHSSGVLDLTEEALIPEVTLIEVIAENPNSYNLHVEIDNWQFTPALTGEDTILNEGHAHVYVNGEKVGRMYGFWFHLGELPEGENHIVVTLNGNDHTDFVANGELLGGEVTITVE
ncbi:MAG: DoxX family membrane protein [Chloroflexota bacterium]